MMQAVRPFILPLLFVMASCSDEPKPTTVGAFIDNPRLLEAAMLRCGQNRAELKYSQECLNAREAVNRLDAVEEAARRDELERQSERKRQALRRTQEAAAAARRRAEEQRRIREEQEYQQIFEQSLDGTANADPDSSAGSASPIDNNSNPQIQNKSSELPSNSEVIQSVPTSIETGNSAEPDNTATTAPASNAPTDIDAIREELKRRQEAPPET